MGMFNSIACQAYVRFFHQCRTIRLFISDLFLCAYIIFLLFAGMLVDRISIRTDHNKRHGHGVLATVLFACSHSLLLAACSHFISGVGNAFCFVSGIKLATRWFPSHRLALVIGIIVTMAMMGGVMAQTPFIFLAQALGWRGAVLVNAGLGVVITLLVILFVRDYPCDYPIPQIPVDKNIPKGFKQGLLLALLNKQNSLGGIYTCFLNLPIILLGALWGVMYLSQVHHLAKTHASLVASMVFVGTIIGSPVAGWLSDYIGKRRLPMIVCHHWRC